MNNLSWGNPVAHRVRVHYNTASKVIYEGMPVCYNFDTTVNWAGGSVSDGAVTASTTLTAGTPETAAAKYLEVEEPSANNIQWFAGVVAKGGWVGKTTSATAGVGQILDIYVPNGAIVPVRTDLTCLIGQTILAITTGSQELGVPLETDSRAVAITEETVNRTTAGLVLAKLNPELFIYQDHAGTALSIDDADTTTGTMVNRINIKFLGTSNYQKGLYATGEITGAGACAYGMWKFRTYISAATTNTCHTLCANLIIKEAGTLSGSGEQAHAAIYATVETDGADSPVLSGGNLAAIMIGYYVTETGGAPLKAYPFSINTDVAKGQFDGLFVAKQAADIGFRACTDTPTMGIPIKIGGVDYWIAVCEAVA